MRTQAVVVVHPGLASAVSVGFAGRRSPPPLLVASPLAAEGDHLSDRATWHGSELIVDDDPLRRALDEARRRGLTRVYTLCPPPGPLPANAATSTRGVDVRTPTLGMGFRDLLAESRQLKVPLHLIPTCGLEKKCACLPTCGERAAGYDAADIADPWLVAQALDHDDDADGPCPIALHFVGPRFCGSTLLGLLLDAHRDIFVAGELDTLRHDFDRRMSCTCHVPLTACGFWGHVAPHHAAGVIDHSTLDGIMRSIAGASGTRVVVDSSKNPGWVNELPDADHRRIVHIVRDGRAYLSSAHRWDRIDSAEAARVWAETHRQSLALVERYGDGAHTVRYEELATDPAAVVDRLCTWLGLAPPPARPDDYVSQQSHQVRGNPMRFSRKPIQLDERWRSELTAADLAAYRSAAGPMATTLGYPTD